MHIIKMNGNGETVYKEFETDKDAVEHYERMVDILPSSTKYSLYSVSEMELPEDIKEKADTKKDLKLKRKLNERNYRF